ncbi:MAG: ABC transporter permease [Rhodospirillaceae bacterium]|nr:ABC transporter permease [Rhodospirillaceae bacterium]MBT7953655.1 ABC transporter permease [Rhodospirillaceae bacterium]
MSTSGFAAGTKPRPLLRTSLGFVAVAVVLGLFGDFEITTLDPWIEIKRMAIGATTPDFSATEDLWRAVINTVAFAILGVALGNALGFPLALAFKYRAVRASCAFIRAIHELFWALIFLQVFGLTPLTGVLAIAIPYAGIFAKVYSEILEESDPAPLQTLPKGTSAITTFMFVRMPDAWVHFKTYALYRLECGLRSSAVLGFVGLPTIGFHLESAFSQGKYSEVAALLIIFYVIIATIRKWVHSRLIPVYILLALLVIPWGGEFSASNILRFFSHDILPHPLRIAETIDMGTLAALGSWLSMMWNEQAVPGIIATVILTQVALVGSGALTLLFFPLISPKFFKTFGRTAGHVFLVVLRSTPEYVLALIFLLLWGPSMLPAAVALALHNGAIIGHLIGRYTEDMSLRPDSSKGLNLYAYDVLPRLYPQFLAFLFYRWEVIMRETAILGILGIATLGFYIDSAFADLRFDRALFLIIITATLNICIDSLSRYIRGRLRLKTTADVV